MRTKEPKKCETCDKEFEYVASHMRQYVNKKNCLKCGKTHNICEKCLLNGCSCGGKFKRLRLEHWNTDNLFRKKS